MQIGERTVASFHYTLTNDAGVQDERTGEILQALSLTLGSCAMAGANSSAP